MTYLSPNIIKVRIQKRIRQLGECSISVTGSFVKAFRKCGQPNCKCVNGGEQRHPSFRLTSKVKQKTKSIYVPVDMAQEVENWVKERQKIKRLLKEIDELSEQLIRQYVKRKRAVNKNNSRLE